MSAWVRAWTLCVGVAWTTAASAVPSKAASEQYQRAIQLHDSGDYEKALASIAEGLAIAPKDLSLLGLKGTLLLELRDYAGALAAYQAYLAAGARGANRREAQKIVADLHAVESTFLEIQAENGPARIYLDSATRGELCTAAPSCNMPMLPGDYKVIAERAGFERWIGHVFVENARTTKLAIKLAENPSLLTVHVAPPGARVTVDATAYDAPARVAPGKHRIVVSLAGYVESRLEAPAHEGAPIELEVALTQLVSVQVEPPAATLVLDGRPVAITNGRIAVPPGSHALVAQAQGFRERRIEILAERAADYRLDIALTRIETAAQVSEPLPARKLIGVGMMDLGVAGLGVGVILSQKNEQTRLGLASGTTGTAVLITGGAALVAGVLLCLTAPDQHHPQAIRLAPTLGDDQLGLAAAGRF